MGHIIRCFKYAGNYRGVLRRMIFAEVLILLWAAIQLFIPILLQILIDVGLNDRVNTGDLTVIFNVCLLIMILGAVAFIASLGAARYSAYIGADYAHFLRIKLYEKIESLSFGNLDRFQTSDLVVRLTSDVNNYKNAIIQIVYYFFRSPFMLIGGVFLALVVAPPLFPIILVILGLTIFILYLYIRLTPPMYRRVQKKLDDLNLVLQENLAGVRVVKAFVRSDHEIKRFDERNDILRDEATKPLKLIAILEPTLWLILNLSIAGSLFFGAIGGNVTSGEMVSFTNLIFSIMVALVTLAILLPMITKAGVSLGRIFKVIDDEPDVKKSDKVIPMTEMKGKVKFHNVSMSYLDEDGVPNKIPVIKNINFTAEPGEMIAILGATGSGKSTLINLIPRFYDVTDGKITIDGVDVRNINIDDLRSHIGIALQTANLFSGNVRNNIKFGADITQQYVEKVAVVADAHGFVDSHVDSYDREVVRKGVNFSGGQRQRISIARALARKPKILILDDSTSAVDVATETRIQAAFPSVLDNTTTFIIAQRISTVLIADKILLMDNGEIVSQGPHKELLKSSPLYREIYESQLGPLED